jgi:hypothetical protein
MKIEGEQKCEDNFLTTNTPDEEENDWCYLGSGSCVVGSVNGNLSNKYHMQYGLVFVLIPFLMFD